MRRYPFTNTALIYFKPLSYQMIHQSACVTMDLWIEHNIISVHVLGTNHIHMFVYNSLILP